MTAAPRTPHPSPRARVPQSLQGTPRQVKFYRLIYGEARGYVEICQSEGPPDAKPKPKVTRIRWATYSPETVDEFAGIVATIAANGRDTYVGWAVYSRPERNKAYALPGPSIFVDDAPDGEYSFTVLTGARRPHGWRILDAPADTATREDLARRMAYTGGDKGGWDITQLVRPPDTINTKRAYGGRHPVGIGAGTQQRYSVEQLQAQFPPVTHTSAAAIEIDDQELKHWLGNVDAIMRRIRPGTFAYQVLIGDGGNNRSNTRWAVAGYLRKGFGLPNVEIAAILLTYCDWGHSREKGSAWLYADVLRCVAGAEKKYPHVLTHATRGTQSRPPVTLPEVTRQPRGRRRLYDVDEYHDWLCEHADCGKVMQTQGQIAAAYGAGIATIRRLEAQLREQGRIARHTSPDRRRSWVTLLGAITNTEAAENEDAAAADLPSEVLSQPGCIMDRAHVGKEHTRPVGPAPEAPSPDPQPQAAAATFPALADAMREAFEVHREAPRITKRRIAGYLEANYPGAPWSDAALCYWYGKVLAERRREREHDRLLASLPSMPHAKLRRLERWCDRLLEEGPDGPHGARFYVADRIASHVAQELASDRRRDALERTKVRRGRRPALVLTLTELDATPPLLALVDVPQDAPSEADGLITPWMPDNPMDVPARAPIAAVCSPLPAGPTALPVEPVEPRPAAAASCSQTIVRPDLYVRLAAQRRAAAVYAIEGA